MRTKDFEQTAMELVCKFLNSGEPLENEEDAITLEDIVIVWKTKVLQHHKAILTCTIPTIKCLFEVTYNGDKHEFYIDVYDKYINYSQSYRKEGESK